MNTKGFQIILFLLQLGNVVGRERWTYPEFHGEISLSYADPQSSWISKKDHLKTSKKNYYCHVIEENENIVINRSKVKEVKTIIDPKIR